MANEIKSNENLGTDKQSKEILVYEYVNQIQKAISRGGANEIFFGILFYALITAVRLLHYDLLYWPPFLMFTIEYYYFWRNLGVSITILGIFNLLFSRVFKNHYDSTQVRGITKILAIIACIFVPIGPFYGVMVLKELKTPTTIIDQIDISDTDLEIKIRQEIGKLQIITALFHIGILIFFYIITVYMSAMMMDLTYPYLVIDTVYLLRYIMLGFALYYVGMMIFGLYYKKRSISKSMRVIGYILLVPQLFMIPLGTYASVSLFKDLRYNSKK